MAAPVLQVKNLTAEFSTRSGVVQAIDGVDFELAAGETLGIVGESGSGKSVTALCIMRLLPQPPARISAGEIFYDQVDLLKRTDAEMRKVRGKEIAMIFQEPMTSLNPVMTIGEQIAEMVRLHENMTRKQIAERTLDMLGLVNIANPIRVANDYPHQLSGGMRQRVMIAMALSCNPKVLIADEPTTALDVTIQAQILELLLELKERLSTAVILITHDMGVIAESAQQVAVMYAGQVIERGSVDELFRSPLHPYTQGLLRSIPRVDKTREEQPRLEQILGSVPTLRFPLKPGCRFAARCSFATSDCRSISPRFKEVSPGHNVACHLY